MTLSIQHGGHTPLSVIFSTQTSLIPPALHTASNSIFSANLETSREKESDPVRTITECAPTHGTPDPPRAEDILTDTTLSRSRVSDSDGSAKETKTSTAHSKFGVGILSYILSYTSLNSLVWNVHPVAVTRSEVDKTNGQNTSLTDSWWNRKFCHWLGVRDNAHRSTIGSTFMNWLPKYTRDTSKEQDFVWDWQNAWTASGDRTEDWASDESVLREIPDYVLEYAPLVHLYSGEQFWPCDIAEHLQHITPTLNYTPLQPQSRHPTLSDLNDLNQWDHARWIYLTSIDKVEERPEWLKGEKNIPTKPSDDDVNDSRHRGLPHIPGRTMTEGLKKNVGNPLSYLKERYRMKVDDSFESRLSDQCGLQLPGAYQDKRKCSSGCEEIKTHLPGGRSDAPAVLITVNKGHGIVDAFWFFFYSFNLGNVVLNVRWGNHVGDWEHSAIRFHHGKPQAIFFSEHNFGSAYSYDAVEKIGKRPVLYSAVGTHAMYSTPGTHPYVLPWGVLHDETDRGLLWDPALNSHSYTYDYKNDTLRSSQLSPDSPTDWFYYAGHWGDKTYPPHDKRQYRFAGQYHYVNGPLGPKFKRLGRRKICGGPDAAPCIIRHWLGAGSRLPRWQRVTEGDESSESNM